MRRASKGLPAGIGHPDRAKHSLHLDAALSFAPVKTDSILATANSTDQGSAALPWQRQRKIHTQ
jgi:hypothetical protein